MTKETKVIKPGAIIGILGGGQLGRMLALAAANLGYKTHIFCPEENSPAFDVSGMQTIADYDDIDALKAFAESVDIVTYEFENIPSNTAAIVSNLKPLWPSTNALQAAQDRLIEKDFLNDNHVKTAPYKAFTNQTELEQAVKNIGRPAVAKTRRFGYDGKGQYVIKTSSDIPAAMEAMKGQPAILEGFVNFDREVSVIVARQESGDVAAFPVCENIHKNHILSETIVPATIKDIIEAKAKVIATRIANALDYVGILTVEMFVADHNNDIIVNEIAPRVHNSGHWTIEGAMTSQFEQHIRAICGLPLGPEEAVGQVRMKNLLGEDILNFETYLSDPSAHYHHYGKRHPRKDRKMGHVTFVKR